jgi:3-methyladenine DNA glycosylase AlkD
MTVELAALATSGLQALSEPKRAREMAAYRQTEVAALWAIPQREGRYLALDWACRFKPFLTLHALPLCERPIREGAWWDTVDVIAAHLVGRKAIGWALRESGKTAPGSVSAFLAVNRDSLSRLSCREGMKHLAKRDRSG